MFTMPAGNLTIDISFTKDSDPTNAYLRWLGTNAGTVIQGGAADDYAYMVILPHTYGATAVESMLLAEGGEGTTEEAEGFRIYAQAENPAAGLELRAGKPGEEGTDDLLNKALPFPEEGLTKYTITVFPEEKTAESRTYYIKVIKVPDLSLKTFKITKDSKDERILLLLDTQPLVYLHFRDGFTIETETNDKDAKVSQSPESITLNANGDPTAVTVTVSKNLGIEVPDEYQKRNYTLNLSYLANVENLKAMATGGYTSFIPGGTDNSFYEVHTFVVEGEQTTTVTADNKGQFESKLIFINDSNKPLGGSVSVLVVAGGGAGGWSTEYIPAAGGAGGYIYYDKYDVSSVGTFSVKVGLGGKPTSTITGGNPGTTRGSNGGNSQFGDDDNRIEAYGGGGGSSHNPSQANSGAKGGSGGGGVLHGGGDLGLGYVPESATSATSATNLASKGGGIKSNNSAYVGAGGGAGGPGNAIDISGNPGAAAGGIGVSSDISGEPRWYAGGGAVGNAAATLDNPEAYGANGGESGADGTGDGGGSYGAGGSGIVIVRFLHSQAD